MKLRKKRHTFVQMLCISWTYKIYPCTCKGRSENGRTRLMGISGKENKVLVLQPGQGQEQFTCLSGAHKLIKWIFSHHILLSREKLHLLHFSVFLRSTGEKLLMMKHYHYYCSMHCAFKEYSWKTLSPTPGHKSIYQPGEAKVNQTCDGAHFSKNPAHSLRLYKMKHIHYSQIHGSRTCINHDIEVRTDSSYFLCRPYGLKVSRGRGGQRSWHG